MKGYYFFHYDDDLITTETEEEVFETKLRMINENTSFKLKKIGLTEKIVNLTNLVLAAEDTEIAKANTTSSKRISMRKVNLAKKDEQAKNAKLERLKNIHKEKKNRGRLVVRNEKRRIETESGRDYFVLAKHTKGKTC